MVPGGEGPGSAREARTLISCRNVARLLSSEQVTDLTLGKRAEVRMHLLLCRYCSRFARQIRQLSLAARRDPGLPDVDSGFEERIIRRMSAKKDNCGDEGIL